MPGLSTRMSGCLRPWPAQPKWAGLIHEPEPSEPVSPPAPAEEAVGAIQEPGGELRGGGEERVPPVQGKEPGSQVVPRQLGRLPGALEVKVSPKENAYHGPLVAYLNQDRDPQHPFRIEALQYLRAEQIRVLTHLAERGELIEASLSGAIWQKLEKDGLLERYRQEHGVPQDWPF